MWKICFLTETSHHHWNTASIKQCNWSSTRFVIFGITVKINSSFTSSPCKCHQNTTSHTPLQKHYWFAQHPADILDPWHHVVSLPHMHLIICPQELEAYLTRLHNINSLNSSGNVFFLGAITYVALLIMLLMLIDDYKIA